MVSLVWDKGPVEHVLPFEGVLSFPGCKVGLCYCSLLLSSSFLVSPSIDEVVVFYHCEGGVCSSLDCQL